MESSAEPTRPHGAPRPDASQALGRLSRLCLKELREILRDRRTIVTLVLMPIMVYPLLSLVFQRFLLSSTQPGGGNESITYYVGLASENAGQHLLALLAQGEALLEGQRVREERRMGRDADEDSKTPRRARPSISWVTAPDLQQQLSQGTIDLIVLARPRSGSDPLEFDLYYCEDSRLSEEVLDYVERRLRAVNEWQLEMQLRDRSIEPDVVVNINRKRVEAEYATTATFATVIPLILILMTVTGAVYPAIDLTAGERERGTLETLIAAPVPRLGLLIAKYVAVVTVALLTAAANLLAMTVTLATTGLSTMIFGEQGLTLGMILQVLGLLVLFASFFSAILLTLTSHARSFKEAQAYLIPLMLLSLGPGILGLMPGLKLEGMMAITPLVNMVLLARDIFQGTATWSLAAGAAILSTALYALAGIAIAARIFGTDAVLYGSQTTWSDLFRRSEHKQPAPTVASAMLCLALLFPCYFAVQNLLSRHFASNFSLYIILCGAVTALLFGGIPLIVAVWNHLDVRQSLRLTRIQTRPMLALVGAAVLGWSLWPAAHEVVVFNKQLGMEILSAEQLNRLKLLLEQLQEIPLPLILISLAIVPGIFEEILFRGFLLSALLNVAKPWQAILVSAMLFGVFHVVGAGQLLPERFLPTTFMGLVLGWVAYRTWSVWPGMLLHAIHNGTIFVVAHRQGELPTAELIGVDLEHVPLQWHLAALVGLVAGTLLILTATPRVPHLAADASATPSESGAEPA